MSVHFEVAGDRRALHEVPRAYRQRGNLRRERRDDDSGTPAAPGAARTPDAAGRALASAWR